MALLGVQLVHEYGLVVSFDLRSLLEHMTIIIVYNYNIRYHTYIEK